MGERERKKRQRYVALWDIRITQYFVLIIKPRETDDSLSLSLPLWQLFFSSQMSTGTLGGNCISALFLGVRSEIRHVDMGFPGHPTH